MAPADRLRHEEALDWVRRLHDPEFADWESHVRWLEADPANVEAFDVAASAIDGATAGLAPPRSPEAIAVNDNIAGEGIGASRSRWLKIGLGFAAAAGLVGLVSLPALMPSASQAYAIETAPGEQRLLALADGTRVALNGGSLIRLDRRDPRSVTIERGEAFFEVRHDAAHPFAVHAGDALFQDVGTAFDVIRNPQVTEVAVREGAVMFDPAGTAVRLDGGQAITIAPGSASVRQLDAAGVGLWRHGRLSYSDADLATVARDIARSIGRPVAIDRAIEDKRFSGVIMIEADRQRMFRHVAAITGVAIRKDGAGWRMASPTR